MRRLDRDTLAFEMRRSGTHPTARLTVIASKGSQAADRHATRQCAAMRQSSTRTDARVTSQRRPVHTTDDRSVTQRYTSAP